MSASKQKLLAQKTNLIFFLFFEKQLVNKIPFFEEALPRTFNQYSNFTPIKKSLCLCPGVTQHTELIRIITSVYLTFLCYQNPLTQGEEEFSEIILVRFATLNEFTWRLLQIDFVR